MFRCVPISSGATAGKWIKIARFYAPGVTYSQATYTINIAPSYDSNCIVTIGAGRAGSDDISGRCYAEVIYSGWRVPISFGFKNLSGDSREIGIYFKTITALSKDTYVSVLGQSTDHDSNNHLYLETETTNFADSDMDKIVQITDRIYGKQSIFRLLSANDRSALYNSYIWTIWNEDKYMRITTENSYSKFSGFIITSRCVYAYSCSFSYDSTPIGDGNLVPITSEPPGYEMTSTKDAQSRAFRLTTPSNITEYFMIFGFGISYLTFQKIDKDS